MLGDPCSGKHNTTMDEKDFCQIFARNILLYPSNPTGGTTASFQLSQKEIQYYVCVCVYVCVYVYASSEGSHGTHIFYRS